MQALTLKKFSNISLSINSTQDLHDLLVLIMDAAKDLLQTEGASLLLYDPMQGDLIFDIVRGPKNNLLASQRVALGKGIAGLVAQTKVPLIVNDAASDERVLKEFDKKTDFVTKNLLAVPLLRENKLIGVLEAVNSLDKRDFSKEDQEILVYLSHQAATAIYNRQLYRDLQERMDELRCIYEISQSISSHFDFLKNVDNILYSIEKTLFVQKISLLMNRDNELHVVSSIGFDTEHNNVSVTKDGIAAYVFRSGDPLLVQNIDEDLHHYDFSSQGDYLTKSFISIPITSGEETVGVLNVADKKDGLPFDSFEFSVLSTVGREISKAYEMYTNQLNNMAIQQLRKDLETAAQIQKNSLMQLPHQYHGLTIASHYEACEAVGGDFYDMVTLGDNNVTFVIGDVSGKGVSAALFMEHVKTLLQSFIPRFKNPRTSVAELNKKILTEKRMSLFVTVMIVQIETESKQLRYASAGHNHQYIIRASQADVISISGKGAPAGTFPVDNYSEYVLSYEPGDVLFLYTDGITEAIQKDYQEYGEERLVAKLTQLAQKRDLAPERIVQNILSDVNAFRGETMLQDDLTILAVQL